jgi:hypothetical protein
VRTTDKQGGDTQKTGKKKTPRRRKEATASIWRIRTITHLSELGDHHGRCVKQSVVDAVNLLETGPVQISEP